MRETKMESVEGINARFGAAGHEKEKKTTEASNSISDHAGIILEALDDYRKWFSENDDSDKKIIKLIDRAIEFVQCA